MKNQVELEAFEAIMRLQDCIREMQGGVSHDIARIDSKIYDQRKLAIARTHLDTAILWLKDSRIAEY